MTPTRTQQLTGFDMVTQESQQKAWTVGLATGFYFDVPYGGVGYSQWNDATTSGPSGTAETSTGGRHFRADIDVPVSDAVPLRVTGSYTSVNGATVDATGVTTMTQTPAQPNGKINPASVDGGTWFLGLTVEKRSRANPYIQAFGGAAVQASLGVAWLSTTTAFSSSNTATIPALSQSGTGIQARVMVMFGGVHVFYRRSDAEKDADRRYNQMVCHQDEPCRMPTSSDYPSQTSPGLDPITPLGTRPINVDYDKEGHKVCTNMQGTTIECPDKK